MGAVGLFSVGRIGEGNGDWQEVALATLEQPPKGPQLKRLRDHQGPQAFPKPLRTGGVFTFTLSPTSYFFLFCDIWQSKLPNTLNDL